MAVIERKIRLVGSKGEKEVIGLFDSGATYSCIKPELAYQLEMVTTLPEPMEFGTVEEERKVIAKEAVRLNFYLDGYRFSDEFMLIPNLLEETIIGAATLQKWGMKLDFEHDEVIIDPKVTKLRLMKFF
ncbi:TPA: hypothetical protein DCX16_03620 [bacterium]|nr:hypothetical protein [bacterium]